MKDGKAKYSSFDNKKIKLKEGETLERAHYEGCPKFNPRSNVLNNFGMPEVKGKSKPVASGTFTNVLDDF
jgi:hypothetical protein